MCKTYHGAWKQNTLIKLAHREMNLEYDALLHWLANARENERNENKEYETERIDNICRTENNNAPITTTNPTNAPAQPQCIPAPPVSMKKRNCFWVPYCKHDASECNGYRKKTMHLQSEIRSH